MDADVLRQIRALGGEGILTEKDIFALNEAVQRVLALMADGQWYSAEEIRMAAGEHGKPATEGLRRMRELRKFFVIEKSRDRRGYVVGISRQFIYRLVFPTQPVSTSVQADEKEGRLF